MQTELQATRTISFPACVNEVEKVQYFLLMEKIMRSAKNQERTLIYDRSRGLHLLRRADLVLDEDDVKSSGKGAEALALL